MTEAEFDIDIDTLKKQISSNLQHFSKYSTKYRRYTGAVEIFKGGAAAFTTALLGIAQIGRFEQHSDQFQMIAILITACLAIVTAWDGLFRNKGLWLMNARTRNDLAGLKDDIEHAEKTDTMSAEIAKSTYKSYKAIWNERNEHWYTLRGKEN